MPYVPNVWTDNVTPVDSAHMTKIENELVYLDPRVPTYGTSLPASPVDGQEAILVDSATNPGYQWRFRWNAGSTSAYKWEFVGGAPASKEFVPAGAFNGTNVAQELNSALQVPLAHAGDYLTNWSIRMSNAANQLTAIWVAKASAVGTNLGASRELLSSTGQRGTMAGSTRLNGLAAGDVLTLAIQPDYFNGGVASSVGYNQAFFSVQPVRVS